MILSDDRRKLLKVTNEDVQNGQFIIPETVTSIGEHAFDGCTGLTQITIPSSVTRIGIDAFRNCTGLTHLTISDSVESIGEVAFGGCTSLTQITIPNSVNSIGEGAFDGCTGLTHVSIPSSVTRIGIGAFRNCTGLTQITIPDSVKSIGDDAFYGCTGLTHVSIPSSVTRIGIGAFRNCTGLTHLTISDSVESIGEVAFGGCTSLTQITIPDSVKSIGDAAFYGCTGLTHVSISGSVESIGRYAFYGCTGLTHFSISGSVTSISPDAFRDCSSLKVIAIEDKDSNEYQRLVNLLPQAQQHLARPWSELNAAITIKQKALTSVAALSMNGLTAHLLSKLLPPKYKGTIVGTAPFFRALNDARRSALLGPDVVVSDFRPHKGLPNQMLPRLCSKLAASFCRYPAVAQIRLPLSQEEFKFEHVTKTAALSRGMLLLQPPTSSPESDSTTQKASFELSDLITTAFLIFMATTSLLYPLAIGLLDIFFLIYPLIYSLSLIWMTFSTDLDQNKITRCLTKTWNERHMVYLFLWPLMIYNVLKICSLYFTHPIVLHLIFTANFCAITLTAISLFGLCALFLDAPIFKNEPFTSDSDPLRKPKKLALFAHAMNSGFYCVNQSLLTLATFISSSMKTPAISLIIAPFVNAALPVGALISTLHFCHLSYRAIQTKNPQLDSGEINSFAKK